MLLSIHSMAAPAPPAGGGASGLFGMPSPAGTTNLFPNPPGFVPLQTAGVSQVSSLPPYGELSAHCPALPLYEEGGMDDGLTPACLCMRVPGQALTSSCLGG